MINQFFAMVTLLATSINDLSPEVSVNSFHKNPAVEELVLSLCDEFDIEMASIKIEYLPYGSELMGKALKISDVNYVIQLNRKLKGTILGEYVVHEMIHIEQYYSGRLDVDNKYYYFISREGKEHKYKKDTRYWQLFHEDEAYRCWKLYRRFIRDIIL